MNERVASHGHFDAGIVESFQLGKLVVDRCGVRFYDLSDIIVNGGYSDLAANEETFLLKEFESFIGYPALGYELNADTFIEQHLHYFEANLLDLFDRLKRVAGRREIDGFGLAAFSADLVGDPFDHVFIEIDDVIARIHGVAFCIAINTFMRTAGGYVNGRQRRQTSKAGWCQEVRLPLFVTDFHYNDPPGKYESCELNVEGTV